MDATLVMNYVFTTEASRALKVERGTDVGLSIRSTLPAIGLIPQTGDWFSDDRLSRRNFVVVGRRFHSDSEGHFSVNLVLDLAPDAMTPRPHAV